MEGCVSSGFLLRVGTWGRERDGYGAIEEFEWVEFLLWSMINFAGVRGCGKKLITGGELLAVGMDYLG